MFNLQGTNYITIISDRKKIQICINSILYVLEKGKIAGLQAAVIARMEKNGPVTDQMRKDVENNVYYDSLINWIKSF